jgi:N-acetylmuramoyl-L-alanine amidase
MITPLTTAQLQYAETRNPYWLKQLGAAWRGDHISAQLPNSPQFAQAVWVFQLARGLTADGICGSNTNAMITKTGYVPVLGAHRILVAGQPVPCDFPVVCKGDPGAMVFTSGFYPEPVLQPKLFVLHWDDALSTASCYDILKKRNLSVQFMGAPDGVMYQGLDPAVGACWQAGSVNLISWGIEINDPVDLKYQDAAHPRPVVPLGVRGDQTPTLGFYPEQIANVVQLCHWVCEFANIPKQLPAHGTQIGVYNSYIQGPGTEWLVNGFTGVCAHYHQDNDKEDSGTSLWPALIASGFKVVKV